MALLLPDGNDVHSLVSRTPERGHALVYKHSPICDLSVRALLEVRRFADAHPEVPVFIVDVIARRRLSSDLARLLTVPHASPQVLWLTDRKAIRNASHFRISADLLERFHAETAQDRN
jgi:bacillithiol system protein YtxJ